MEKVKNIKSQLDAALLAVFIAVFLLVFLLLVITTTLVTFILPESFASSSRIRIERKARNDAATTEKQTSLNSYDPYLMQTELEIIQSELVLKAVIEDLGLNERWGKKYTGGNEQLKTSESLMFLRSRLEIRPVRGTSLIEIRVFSDNPQEAADIANAIPRAYKKYIASNSKGLQAEVVDSAQPGLRPVRPNKPLNITLGIVIGVILGLAAGSFSAWMVLLWRRRTLRPPPIPA